MLSNLPMRVTRKIKPYLDPLYAAQEVVFPVAAPEDVKMTFPFALRRCGIEIWSIATREKKLTSKQFYSRPLRYSQSEGIEERLRMACRITFIRFMSMFSIRN